MINMSDEKIKELEERIKKLEDKLAEAKKEESDKKEEEEDPKPKEDKDWIEKAVEHPGKLKEEAKKEDAINKEGNIELGKMEDIAEKKIESGDKKEGEKLKKEVNLAKNLKKIRKKKGNKKEKKSSDWW